MFSSFVIHDMVEVEPAYFPTSLQTLHRGVSHAASNGNLCAPGGALATKTKASSSCASPPAGGAEVAQSEDPSPYAVTLRDVLLHRLSERYVGRIVPRCGLCVAIGDIVDYSAADIKGPSASAWMAAVFTACIFRPTPGTRMRAVIAGQNPAGLSLHVDFFSAYSIFVPGSELVPGSLYHSAKGAWYLPVEAEEEEGQPDSLPQDPTFAGEEDFLNFYTNGESVVLRVTECVVRDALACSTGGEAGADFGGGSSPVPPAPNGGGGNGSVDDQMVESLPLMEVLGSFAGDGLGPTSWFEEQPGATSMEAEA